MQQNFSDQSQYINPLTQRYAGKEMGYVFSPDHKFSTWRKLWIALAESEKQLGLPITDEQIEEMKQHVSDIDYQTAREYERKMRHDVMAHVHTYGQACPKAKPIIHLGATSAYVGDNTDLIQLREGCRLLLKRFGPLLRSLSEFAKKYRNLPTLGFTHFQPAQLTTVGKRACLWLLDIAMDFEDLARFEAQLPFRGVKGTTGTQASFLKLFGGDHHKVKQLDLLVSEKMGFEKTFGVTGQTYSRKIDARIGAILSGIAQSLHKMANDIRLLQHLKEVEEPFEKNQIGSSAMAYKRNPMRSERLTSLCRFIQSLSSSPEMTAAEQWFERTLDDSANKRLSIPQMFLAADACMILAENICDGLVVYPKVIEKRVREELPFMATENIIMEAVKQGKDRQTLHESIRVHSIEAAKQVKMEGKPNDLLERILADETFGISKEQLDTIMDVHAFIGRAPEQTDEFLAEQIVPLIDRAERYGQITRAEITV
ncbi:MAG: adenylosuccinate lyase [Fibrobacterota bacterium]